MLLSELIDDTIVELLGTMHEQLNILASDLQELNSNVQDTVFFTTTVAGVIQGGLLSIEEETLYVLAVSPSNNSATVLRGVRSSTAAAHESGAVITINPLWPRDTVMNALRKEIRSWPPQVFSVQTVDIPVVTWQRGYNFPTNLPVLPGFLDVRMKVLSDLGDPNIPLPPTIFDDTFDWITIPAECDVNAPVSDFPAGQALFLRSEFVPDVPSVLHVSYAVPFDVDGSWNENTDVVADVGLQEYMLDIPPLGVAGRLLRSAEVRRVQTAVQGQNRDAAQVPALAIIQAADDYERRTKERLSDARMTLLAQFPIRVSTT